MKRIILYCLLNLLIVNVCSSQNTYPKILNDSLVVITNSQLRTANLIFLEHKKLFITDSILNSQLKNYEDLIISYKKSDSIQNIQIKECLLKIEKDYEDITKLQKTNKKLSMWSKIKSWIIVGSVILLITL